MTLGKVPGDVYFPQHILSVYVLMTFSLRKLFFRSGFVVNFLKRTLDVIPLLLELFSGRVP